MSLEEIAHDSQPFIDISEFDFDLDSKLDNPYGLELFERRAIGAADQMIGSRTEFAYSIHMILQNHLYRFALDSNGEPYKYADEYLRDFSHRVFVGISTMKAYHTAVRMARQLGFSADEIMDKGIYVFTEVSKEVIKDRQTAAPLRLRNSNKQPEDLENYLVETIEELASHRDKPDMSYRPSEFRAHLETRLNIGKPQIWFQKFDDGYYWYYQKVKEDGTLDHRDGKIKIQFEGDPPQEVTDKLLTALKISDT